MNVLVIGGGGREHALCWALSRSPRLGQLFCAPGNAGIAEIAQCVPLDWQDGGQPVADFCRHNKIGLIVIGPEAPLAAGLADTLRTAGLRVIGPSAQAAKLESSKQFMRQICTEQNIPAPRHACFADASAAKSHVEANYSPSEPVVIKADGLAAGKGVVMAANRQEALAAIDQMFDGRFGAASSKVLVEECLHGREASFFFLCDGAAALPLGEARDYKRAGDGDTGDNTGGMGAYSPLADLDAATRAAVAEDIVAPTLHAMARRGTPFTGFLYAGVMLTASGAKLLEFNVRLGDPEAQVVLPRLRSDVLDLFLAACSGAGALRQRQLQWDQRACLTVVMAAQGYPGDYAKGETIAGLEEAAAAPDAILFHAGTTRDSHNNLVSAGGRVLAVSALGENLAAARRSAYTAIVRIDWPGGVCRYDIGAQADGADM